MEKGGGWISALYTLDKCAEKNNFRSVSPMLSTPL
jgi:hypothetical protein